MSGLESADRRDVEQVGQHRWRYDGVEYVLSKVVTECHECDRQVGPQEYGYLREDADALDEVCWSCGQQVTGLGERP